MTMMTSTMVMLSVTLVMITIPGIYSNRLLFKEYAEEGDIDKLIELQSLHNQWIVRHLCMALLALGFATALKHMHELEMHSQTAVAMAVYSAICFTLAFVESLMAQKVSGYAATILQPVKERQKKQRNYYNR